MIESAVDPLPTAMAGLPAVLTVAALGSAGAIKLRSLGSEASRTKMLSSGPLTGHLGIWLHVFVALVEIAVSVTVIVDARIGGIAAAGLLIIYTLYLLISRRSDCACFGGAFEFGGRAGMISRNLILLLLAVLSAAMPTGVHRVESIVLGTFVIGIAFGLDRIMSIRVMSQNLRT